VALVAKNLPASAGIARNVGLIPGSGIPWRRKWHPIPVFLASQVALPSGKELTCQCRRDKRLGFDPWVGKICWRRAWKPTPVFMPGESLGLRSLAGYSA